MSSEPTTPSTRDQPIVHTIDRTGCLGNTIKVAAGHYVDLADPSPESIEIGTVAASLSKLCRFGCHCPRFYSVAEHCIHATALAVSEGFAGDALRAVFLHDAAEAYIGDVVKPLKVMLPDYAVVEQRMEKAVAESFGVDFVRWADTVKRFDRMMLKAEKLTLWPDDREEWTGFAEIDHRQVRFQFWMPDDAEREFLRFAETLGFVV